MSFARWTTEQESLEGEVGDGEAAPWLNIRYIWMCGGQIRRQTQREARCRGRGRVEGGIEMSIFPLHFPSVALIWEFPLNHAGGSHACF